MTPRPVGKARVLLLGVALRQNRCGRNRGAGSSFVTPVVSPLGTVLVRAPRRLDLKVTSTRLEDVMRVFVELEGIANLRNEEWRRRQVRVPVCG